jgi:hypothetical protein
MNEKNTPMRYALNLHRTRPDWPTKLDVVWEVVKHASSGRSGEFLDSELDSLFAGSEDKARQHLAELYGDGTFVKSRTSGERVHYKIAKERNPFV